MINREEFRSTVTQLAQECTRCPLSVDLILKATMRFFDEDIPLSTATQRSLLSAKHLEVAVRTSLSVMLHVMNRKEAKRQMLELMDNATKGHGLGFADINFNALLHIVQGLQDDADAALPVQSHNARMQLRNESNLKSDLATAAQNLCVRTTRSGTCRHSQQPDLASLTPARSSSGLRIVKEEPEPISSSNTCYSDDELEDTDGTAEAHSESSNGNAAAVPRKPASRNGPYPRNPKDFTGLIERVCDVETGLKRYNCKIASCSLFFASPTGCRQHICRDHWKIKYRCKLCGLEGSAKQNFYRHMRKNHRGAHVDKHVVEIRTQAMGRN